MFENIKRAYPNASKQNPGKATIDIKENNERKIIFKIIDCGKAYTGQIGIGLSNVIKNCRKSLATPIFPKRNTKKGKIKEFTIEFHKWD